MDGDKPAGSQGGDDRTVPPFEKRKRSFRLTTVVASVPSLGDELCNLAVKSVETFGQASTGTPIRLLKGVAKENATLAKLGNGPKIQGLGHFGMAGGNAALIALGYLPLAGALALDVVAIVLEERRRAGGPIGDELSTE